MSSSSGTSRSSMVDLVNGTEPGSGERTIRYSVRLTDSYDIQTLGVSFYDSPATPANIDGYVNDDSYRRSRRLVKDLADAEIENLRENSLARQLQDKPDRQATIRVIRRQSAEERDAASKNSVEPSVPWTNIIPPNTKFFLESVQESRDEKVQVIDTFGDQWKAFFFGRKPEVYAYQGTLLNAANHNWKNEFQENYDHFMRGSEAVKNKAIVVLQYDDVVVEGYMLNTSLQMTGVADKSVPFAFSMLVTRRSPIDPRAILYARIQRGGVAGSTSAEMDLLAMMNSETDLKEKALSDMNTFLLMREFLGGNYVPGSGSMKLFEKTNTVEASVSIPPGGDSGTANSASEPNPFAPEQTNRMSVFGFDPTDLSPPVELE